MNDPLVSQIEAKVFPPATQTDQPAPDVERSVASWLGIESDSKEAKFILGELQGDNILDALTELKDLERRIGPAKFGENRAQRLHDYLKVLSSFKQSKAEVEKFER